MIDFALILLKSGGPHPVRENPRYCANILRILIKMTAFGHRFLLKKRLSICIEIRRNLSRVIPNTCLDLQRFCLKDWFCGLASIPDEESLEHARTNDICVIYIWFSNELSLMTFGWCLVIGFQILKPERFQGVSGLSWWGTHHLLWVWIKPRNKKTLKKTLRRWYVLSVENQHFSGVTVHYLCIFNRKFKIFCSREKMPFVVQLVRSTTSRIPSWFSRVCVSEGLLGGAQVFTETGWYWELQ